MASEESRIMAANKSLDKQHNVKKSGNQNTLRSHMKYEH